MRKIGRAVERIDDPFSGSRFTTLAGNGSRLFRENRMIGVTTPDGIDDKRFAFLIGRGNEVGAALQLDELFAIRVVLEDVAGRSGQLNGEFQILHFGLIHSGTRLGGSYRFHQFEESLVGLQFAECGLTLELLCIPEPVLNRSVEK